MIVSKGNMTILVARNTRHVQRPRQNDTGMILYVLPIENRFAAMLEFHLNDIVF